MRCKKGSIFILNRLNRVQKCLAAIIIMILVTGCAASVSKTPPEGFKEEIQMTDHWDVITMDIARQIQVALENAGIYEAIPISLKTSGETSFGEAFRNLLIKQLTTLGITVVQEENDAILFIENRIRVICHGTRRIVDPLSGTFETFTGLSEAVVVARGGAETTVETEVQHKDGMNAGEFTEKLPLTEVIITTILANEVDYFMRNSDIYYISDADFGCHADFSPNQEQVHEKGLSDQISDEMSEEVAEPISDQIPEQAPDSIFEQAPEQISEPVSDQMSDEMSERVAEPISEQAPEQISEQIPERVPEQISTDISEETPEQISREVEEQLPEQMSEQIPERFTKPAPTLKVKGLD